MPAVIYYVFSEMPMQENNRKLEIYRKFTMYFPEFIQEYSEKPTLEFQFISVFSYINIPENNVKTPVYYIFYGTLL